MNPDNQNPEQNSGSGPHSAAVVEPKPSRRLSLVWVVPVIAALVGLGLAAKAIMERGPEITLQFKAADGLEAGKTKIKYKDVEIGLVKSIVLSSDQNSVYATADIVREAAPLLVDDTRFWVVKPRIGLAGVSGLGTLLSGAYIGLDVGKSKAERRRYTGLEEPPPIASERPGREFTLKSDDLGSLDVGSPIYLRRVQVGRVVTHALDKDGRGVTLTVFIDEPYDKLINPATRFFLTSGIDITLDDKGFKMDVQSLATLIQGGIAFKTGRNDLDLEPAPAKAEFNLFEDEKTAMRVPDGIADSYVFQFNESVRGLQVGSTIDFRGVTVGEVTSIGIDMSPDKQEVLMVVEADIYRSRLSRQIIDQRKILTDRKAVEARTDLLIKKGMRAQMRSGSLVTGENYIALDFFRDAKPASIDRSKPIPVFPTLPGKFSRLEEDLMLALEVLKTTMTSMNALLVRLDKEVETLAPDVKLLLTEVQRTLASADKLMASDAPVQQEMKETLREVARAAASLRQLTDMLEQQPEALIQGKKGAEQ